MDETESEGDDAHIGVDDLWGPDADAPNEDLTDADWAKVREAVHAYGTEVAEWRTAYQRGPKPTVISSKLIADRCVGPVDHTDDDAYTDSILRVKRLQLDHCNIHKLENLDPYSDVVYAYFQHNSIPCIPADAFDMLFALRVVVLSHNMLAAVENVAELPSLQVLDVSYNRIASVSPSDFPSQLRYLYLEGNPVPSGEPLLQALTAALPTFLQLDGTRVTNMMRIRQGLPVNELKVADLEDDPSTLDDDPEAVREDRWGADAEVEAGGVQSGGEEGTEESGPAVNGAQLREFLERPQKVVTPVVESPLTSHRSTVSSPRGQDIASSSEAGNPPAPPSAGNEVGGLEGGRIPTPPTRLATPVSRGGVRVTIDENVDIVSASSGDFSRNDDRELENSYVDTALAQVLRDYQKRSKRRVDMYNEILDTEEDDAADRKLEALRQETQQTNTTVRRRTGDATALSAMRKLERPNTALRPSSARSASEAARELDLSTSSIVSEGTQLHGELASLSKHKGRIALLQVEESFEEASAEMRNRASRRKRNSEQRRQELDDSYAQRKALFKKGAFHVGRSPA